MSYDAQSELFQALKSHPRLSEIVKGGFHNRVAKQDAPFPRVVYTRLRNEPTKHADGNEFITTVDFQLSIFTDSETVSRETELERILDELMKSLDYRKYDAQSLYETDTGVYHVPLRYEKNFYKGE